MKPELLSPAGSLKSMRYAFAYGADAVYAGQPRYSLRVRNNEFNIANLAAGIEQAHQQQKKFYIVSNIAAHNNKLASYLADIKPVIQLQPDALIMSDPGLIMIVKEQWPDQEIHLSVQANTVNWAAVQFWQKQGIKRIILSRELSLAEIAEIRHRCPDIELEVFIHGSLCIAYSGRCLLSGYINKRDANQGACTNACRWQYNIHPAQEDGQLGIIPKIKSTINEELHNNKVFLLQESKRPEEYLPAFEDEHGSYILNSKDLRAIQHVATLAKMGVNALKIEGRTKSFYYAARTAQLYRQAIDDAACGKDFNPDLLQSLEGLANRGYTEGFLQRHTHSKYQNYQYGHSVSYYQQFVGELSAYCSNSNLMKVIVKNKFLLGDNMELLTPKGNQAFKLSYLENERQEVIDIAPGSGHNVYIRLPDGLIDCQFGLLLRNIPQQRNSRQPY